MVPWRTLGQDMGRAVICKGDPTSHGGKVLEGLTTANIAGRPIAAIGHKVYCPLCKGTFPIVEGVPFHTFGGRGTAVEGMRTGCGATLIATQHSFTIDIDIDSSANPVSKGLDKAAANDTTPEQASDLFDQHFLIVDRRGVALPDMPYTIQADPARLFEERPLPKA